MPNKTSRRVVNLDDISSILTPPNPYAKELISDDIFSNLIEGFVRNNKDVFNQGLELNEQGKKDLDIYLENNCGYVKISQNAYAILNWDYQDFLLLPTKNNPKYTNVHLDGNFFFEIYPCIVGRQESLIEEINESNQYKSLGFGTGLASAVALMAYNVFTQPTASGMACATIPILALTGLGFMADERHKYKLRRENDFLERILTGPMADCITTGSLAIEKALGLYEPTKP